MEIGLGRIGGSWYDGSGECVVFQPAEEDILSGGFAMDFGLPDCCWNCDGGFLRIRGIFLDVLFSIRFCRIARGIAIL